MPILIKGSGGAQKVPEISVSSSGLITAKAGTKSATKQLDSSMDADFVESNIRNGVNLFGKKGTLEVVEEIDIANGSVPISIDSSGKLIISISNVKRIVGFGLFIDSDNYYIQFGSYFGEGKVHAVLCSPKDDVGSNGYIDFSITESAIVLDCSAGRIGSYMIGSDIGQPKGSVAVVRG